MTLESYRKKRNFRKTSEPDVDASPPEHHLALRFVIHWHAATLLHFDLRLEIGGSFKSWAVPKGPSLDPHERRMAVHVEDHPLAYGDFEGVIPEGNYGAGTVMIWDRGTYHHRGNSDRQQSDLSMQKGLHEGHLTFVLYGQKLNGEFSLIRSQKQPKHWMLVKKRDAFATREDVMVHNRSVATKRSLEDIAKDHLQHLGGDLPLAKRQSPPLTQSKVKTEKIQQLVAPVAKHRGHNKPLPNSPTLPLAISHRPKNLGDHWFVIAIPAGIRAFLRWERQTFIVVTRKGLPLTHSCIPETVRSELKFCTKLAWFDIILTPDDKMHIIDLLAWNHLLSDETADQRWVLLLTLVQRFPWLASHVLPHREHLEEAEQDTKTLGKECRYLFKYRHSSYPRTMGREWQIWQPTGNSVRTHVVTNPEKILWPREGITKQHLLDYYHDIGPYLLPHLADRPQSLHRHPNGIDQPGFFQKDIQGHVPHFLQTVTLISPTRGKAINYCLCHNMESLLYLANLGCIELNPWLAKYQNPEYPQFVVIDLDPDQQTFKEVKSIALAIHDELEDLNYRHYIKTSGGRGLHIALPIQGIYSFDTAREVTLAVARRICEKYPDTCTIERTKSKRGGRLYIDCFQNRRAQTLASIYCLRPRPGAPASAPLEWHELDSDISPEDFNIRTLPQRIKEKGDLWSEILTGPPIDPSQVIASHSE